MSERIDDNLDPEYAELEYDEGIADPPETKRRHSNGNGNGGRLKSAAQSRPVFRILLILLPVVVVTAVVIILLGFQKEVPESVVSGASSDVSDPPLTLEGEISPLIEKATNEDSFSRAQQAVREQGSSIPTPIAVSEEIPDLVTGQVDIEIPLERWRNDLVRDPPPPPPEQVTVTVPATPPPPPPVVVDLSALSQAMAAQMGTILQSRIPGPMEVVVVSSPPAVSVGDAPDTAGFGGAGAGQPPLEQQPVGSTVASGDVIVPAGTIYSGRTLIASDSDVPGPVLVEISNGPFRGGRAIGSFTSNGRLLTLTFSTVVFKGESYTVDAVALDPETSLAGIATDVDNRYFSRAFLPAAAEFIVGFTEAVGDSVTTVEVEGDVIIQNQDELDTEEELAEGANAAAEKIADLLDDSVQDEPRVTIDSGTAVAIMFVEEVLTTSLSRNVAAEQNTAAGPLGFGQTQNPLLTPFQRSEQPQGSPQDFNRTPARNRTGLTAQALDRNRLRNR